MAERTLNDVMQFGHLIRVVEGGAVHDDDERKGVAFYVPESIDVETDEDGQILKHHEKAMIDELYQQGWTFAANTSQMGGGVIMHSSEYIGGRLEQDIRETPGFYVAVTVDCVPQVEDAESESAGWAVLYRES